MIKLLKEYVRLLFEVSEEEYLLSLESGSQVENELAKHGIVPIKRPQHIKQQNSKSYSSLLGRGDYTFAFEVLYKGKRAVAKVTDSEKDIDNVLALDALREQLPADVAKHVLQVYAYVDLPKIKRECVVVEMLAPMPASLKHEYWGGSELGGKDYDRSKLRYDALVDKIDEFLLTVLSVSNLRLVLDKNELRGLRNRIVNNKDFDALKPKFLSTSIPIETYLYKIFYKELSSKQFSEKLKQKKYDVDQMASALTDKFVDYMFAYVTGDKVPVSLRDKKQLDLTKMHEDKRVKSFVRALEYLRDKHGVNWFDMHKLNVMVRPSTGDLVISDPGLFRMPSRED